MDSNIPNPSPAPSLIRRFFFSQRTSSPTPSKQLSLRPVPSSIFFVHRSIAHHISLPSHLLHHSSVSSLPIAPAPPQHSIPLHQQRCLISSSLSTPPLSNVATPCRLPTELLLLCPRF
ncbi:unnamed protein product [Cuscuta epithymum]|uniref:Uncharacterized protein n=1 Tax=Cuscuta epithymum TaxID=186058 RepID=A0AAV0DH97_9ASTE|nr:unnamed protein product [Cuscuta epithymum]